MSDAARRADLTAQIIELEPQMLRARAGPGPRLGRRRPDDVAAQDDVRPLLGDGPADGTSGLRVGEVARGLGVTLPTVTAVMDKLVERGLVGATRTRSTVASTSAA